MGGLSSINFFWDFWNVFNFAKPLKNAAQTFQRLMDNVLKCYYRPTASLQLNNKRNTKYNITVT